MITSPWLIVITACAAVSSLMFIANALQFRRSRSVTGSVPPLSVLIPARNEADGIRQTLTAVLANQGIEFEVVVLDDHSEDETAQIVQEISQRDSRVRLVKGKLLPVGWCGKQFACHQLANYAKYDELLFMDADVHLMPDALARAVGRRQQTQVDLLSGFPKQVVGTLGEAMLLPLMHIVLLTYLPFLLMRRTSMQAASAGCGQFFLTHRDAYHLVGGHEAVKGSLHDGVQLPRAYRFQKLRTDVFDASDVAQCRMYVGWRETWNGLSKNAYEGIANERLIVPFSIMMFAGFVAPCLVGAAIVAAGDGISSVAMAAVLLAYLPRLIAAYRFDRAWFSVPLFPLSILLFLAIQWWALCKHFAGVQSTWRGRAYPAATS